jgi:hypothetical protein
VGASASAAPPVMGRLIGWHDAGWWPEAWRPPGRDMDAPSRNIDEFSAADEEAAARYARPP